MPSHMYMVVSTGDTKDTIDALEAKANSLGLGPLRVVKDIARETDRSHMKPFRRRHYGYKLYLEARPHDTVVFPSFARAFNGFTDLAHNLKRWVPAGVRVIIIDLGIDTASEFGRNWTAVYLKVAEARDRVNEKLRLKIMKRTHDRGKHRGLLGVTRKGSKGSKYYQVEPMLYELAMKCQAWVKEGWSYDSIETHLWKSKVYRVLKFAPKVLAVEAIRDPLFARKWSATAIKTLVRNVEKINEGVLSGLYRLPKMWRPSEGPLAGIPFKQPAHRPGYRAPESHWNQAKAIGDKVRELRKERRWTQAELGQRCGGIAQSQIADVERGAHNPRPPLLAKLAAAFEVSAEVFNLKPAVPV